MIRIETAGEVVCPVAETPVTPTLAFPTVVTEPTWPVDPTPVTVVLVRIDTAGAVVAPVADAPLTENAKLYFVVGVPTCPVEETPVTAVFALPDVETVPTPAVDATPVTDTSTDVPVVERPASGSFATASNPSMGS